MPTYVYEVVNPDGSGGDAFECVQTISEPPLVVHPVTGEPVRRVIQAPFIGGTWSEGAMHKRTNDNKKLGELGFTKYVKAGDGVYEKTAGKGPQVITKDNPITSGDLSHLD